ncbi:hypothetical protein [Hymenobacter psychrotolerans]|uniref:GLPGLI family protein n=1 Tax=Hymenobacter psychrotolerans DSM 18569 TaxID=1121959 RepID=A0A1M6PJ96_9BACT|nr:hypothetical protein [Hymenobacter psychrotolerans]SHK08003.1 hypothetical protein SAMN02746009_00256 [Hymenobacter psychrotolerans DSM 18569]
MKLIFSAALLLATSVAAQAQQAPADSVRAAETSSRSAYAPGEVMTPEGKQVKAYFPISVNGFEKSISYFNTHPEVRPFPQPRFISVDKIHSMTVRGQYSETLKLNGKSLHILAARLVNGPVELFNFAEAKSVPVPLPVPGAVFTPIAGIPYTKNHWYLRRNGELAEVKRGKFEEQLSEYLSTKPELAARVKAKAEGYRYQDMVRIITEYNQPAGSSAN